MSELVRGGPQQIPRPPDVRPGAPARWPAVERITVADVRVALIKRGEPSPIPEEVPPPELDGAAWRPAAVLCALFDDALAGEVSQAQVVLTRRSTALRSHTGEVSFPGGGIDEGEDPVDAALREAKEEIGIDPSSVEIIGRLRAMQTVRNPAPIVPWIGVLPGPPELVPNPAEVDRAFTVPLVELLQPEVYREELWMFPDGFERAMQFFELVGDTVWGATARMLTELLELVVAVSPSTPR